MNDKGYISECNISQDDLSGYLIEEGYSIETNTEEYKDGYIVIDRQDGSLFRMRWVDLGDEQTMIILRVEREEDQVLVDKMSKDLDIEFIEDEEVDETNDPLEADLIYKPNDKSVTDWLADIYKEGRATRPDLTDEEYEELLQEEIDQEMKEMDKPN